MKALIVGMFGIRGRNCTERTGEKLQFRAVICNMLRIFFR